MNSALSPATGVGGNPAIIRESVPSGVGLMPVLTLVLWLGCLVVGVFGYVLPYVRPHASAPAKPVTVELLNVELAQDLTPPDVQRAPGPSPNSADAMVSPDIPPAASVAQPATVAFAVPVEGPVRIVDVQNANYARSAPSPAVLPAPTRLTFGQGEGRQPAPEYPLRARREGQEGTVTVRFTVDESGRVRAAEAVQASLWPLLNESAVNTIRERWLFKSGPVRAYEVAIRFELTR